MWRAKGQVLVSVMMSISVVDATKSCRHNDEVFSPNANSTISLSFYKGDFTSVIVEFPSDSSVLTSCKAESKKISYKNARGSDRWRSRRLDLILPGSVILKDLEPCSKYRFKYKTRISGHWHTLDLPMIDIGPRAMSFVNVTRMENDSVVLSWLPSDECVSAFTLQTPLEGNQTLPSDQRSASVSFPPCQESIVSLSGDFNDIRGRAMTKKLSSGPGKSINLHVNFTQDKIVWNTYSLLDCKSIHKVITSISVGNAQETPKEVIDEVEDTHTEFGEQSLSLNDIQEELSGLDIIGPCQSYLLDFDAILGLEDGSQRYYKILTDRTLTTNSMNVISFNDSLPDNCSEQSKQPRTGRGNDYWEDASEEINKILKPDPTQSTLATEPQDDGIEADEYIYKDKETQSEKSSDSSGLLTFIAVGIPALIVTVAIIVALIVFVVRRKKQRRRKVEVSPEWEAEQKPLNFSQEKASGETSM